MGKQHGQTLSLTPSHPLKWTTCHVSMPHRWHVCGRFEQLKTFLVFCVVLLMKGDKYVYMSVYSGVLYAGWLFLLFSFWLLKVVQVSIRGAQHSMGGHTITPDGHVIDMRHFDSLRYDPEQDLVTAGSGAHVFLSHPFLSPLTSLTAFSYILQWSDLIRYLNSFGKSPRTMQSYSTFRYRK